MAGNQYGGWGSTTNAANIQPIDAFSRIMLMRYGGRTDNLFDYRDETGYKREMGPAGYYDNSNSSLKKFQSSGMAETNYGGRNTPNDPGGYNWSTLQRSLGKVSDAVTAGVNYRMESKRFAKAKQAKQDADFLENAENTYLATFDPSRNYNLAYNMAVTTGRSGLNPGLSLSQAQQLAARTKSQYFGVTPTRKSSRTPSANKSPKAKNTAPKITPPKAP